MNDLIKRDEIQQEGPDWRYFGETFLLSQIGLAVNSVEGYRTGIKWWRDGLCIFSPALNQRAWSCQEMAGRRHGSGSVYFL